MELNTVKIENLKRMEFRLRSVPPDMFDISKFRDGNYNDYEEESKIVCGTAACVVGWCTDLDAENIQANFLFGDGIDFMRWSREFTGLEKSPNYSFSKNDVMEYLWDFMFSGQWEDVDNTIDGARKRILYVIDALQKDQWEQFLAFDLLEYPSDEEQNEFLKSWGTHYGNIQLEN